MIGDRGAGLAAASGEARREAAREVAECVLGQLRRPYPCSASQVLRGPDDLALPVERFPVFFGSFDWHSCVHSHWALARLLAEGLLDPLWERRVASALDESLRPDALRREAASWERLPAHTERPYGLTWLLVLDAELARPEVARAHPAWRPALGPLVDVLLPRVRDWVRGLSLPVRSGVHSDTAWSLALAWDWAEAAGDAALRSSVAARARALYLDDACAPCAYEPSGETFSSPIMNEAALMARVLDAEEFDRWMRGFLPAVFAGRGGGSPDGEDPLLPDPAAAWDGESYLGVHEVALPLARCIAARDAASALADQDARAYMASQARRWERKGMEGLVLDGCLADHWVGSFVVASLGCRDA